MSFTMSLFSCSNNELEDSFTNEAENKLENQMASDSIYLINSDEDIFDLFGIEPQLLTFDSISSKPMLRNISYKTINGYISITNTSKYRTTFTSAMASQLGLYANQVYHVYMKYLKNSIAIPSGYSIFEDNSPSCGYQPVNNGTDFQKRGYKMDSGSTTVTLTSHIFYVDCEEWGQNIRKNYPCDPASVKWNYILWKD